MAPRSKKTLLFASVAVTLGLYLIPFGRFIAYPLLLLSTLAHELGHGITAVLVGGDFDRFQMFWDGSGVAHWSGRTSEVTSGDVALIAAGGLVGPALVAAACFGLARGVRAARIAFGVLAALLVLAELLVVRNAFGFVFVAVVAAAFGALAWKAPAEGARTALVFLGTQLALAVFSRSDYLFTATARTSAGSMPSDVKVMSLAVGLPYWLWGAICGLFSLAVLALGAFLYLYDRRATAPARS